MRACAMAASFKIIYRHIGEFANALGFGFDVGSPVSSWRWMAFWSTDLRDVDLHF
ncbi:MAG: hypothetical protein U5L96_14150 [Owenweeksia sp.]|nr:hypothetical protein [Owenweeksia sp.]